MALTKEQSKALDDLKAALDVPEPYQGVEEYAAIVQAARDALAAFGLKLAELKEDGD